MKTKRVRWISVVLLPLMAILIAVSGRLPAGADVSSPAELVQRAWANARDAGSYRFVSDIHETLIPRAVPEMIGEQDQSLDLALDGAVVMPDQAYVDLRMAGNQQSGAVTLLHDGQQSFMVQDGQIKPVEDTLSLASPTNDLLGYLAGAKDVTALDPPDGHPELARYGFDLDGVRFEQYVRRQAQGSMEAEPGAPDDLSLSANTSLQSITGHGELWVDEAGLPVRQVLDVEMPEASAKYSARLHMVIDFTAHGLVQSLPQAVQGTDGAWHVEGQVTTSSGPAAPSGAIAGASPVTRVVTTPTLAWRSWLSSVLPLRIAPSSVALFLLVVLAILMARFYRRDRRHCYALIVSVLIASMVFGSLLQAGQVVRFADRQARAADERKAATPDLLDALGLVTQEARPAASSQEPPAKAETVADDRPAPAALRSPVLPQEPARAAPARPTLQGENGETVLLFCGEGEPGVDTDGDGLTDQVELCLGTDYQDADTDDDRIADAIEVNGFDYGGKHWESDPLMPDSNDDGMLDALEWSDTLTPEGQADSIDQDGDGLPDLWDDDNDGDGVPDKLDLSPSAKTGYETSMDLSAGEGGSTDYYEYVEVQLQPEDLNHLRYSTTPLDWPYDEQGNVRDLNDWPHDDLRLIPFLLVHTNVRPNEQLAEKYSFRVWDSETGGYELLAPLQPVEQGGEIYAFYAKVAYEPGGWGRVINWQAKMVWMTQMQLDTYNYYYLASDPYHTWPQISGISSEQVVLHQYVDSFRLAGLKVTKDLGYEAAVIGTPTSPAEDLELFRLQLGLNQTFRSYVHLEGQEEGETALEEIAQRFAPGTTADLAHTFDVDPNHVRVAAPVQYGHQDAGLAGVGTDMVPDYLDTYDGYYAAEPLCEDADGNDFYCASLLTAYEQSLGVADLSDFQIEQRTGVRCSRYFEWDGQVDYDWCVEWEDYVSWEGLSTNLANTHVFTTRGVQFRMYEQGANQAWDQVTPARMLTFIEQRYKNVYGTALRDYYPDLTNDDVRMIAYMAYLMAIGPSYAAIAVDGQALVPELADEQQLALDRALDEAFEIDTALDLIGAGTGIAFAMTGFPQILWAGQDAERLWLKWALGTTGWNIFNVTAAISFGAATLASTVMGIINAICSVGDDRPMCRNEEALYWANVAVSALAIIAQAQYLIQLIGDLVKSGACSLTNVAIGSQAVGMIIGIATSWVFFGLTVANSGGDPMVWHYELAYAIISTVWYILLFALNFIPVIGPLIATVLSLLDMIVGFILGLFGIDWDIVDAIVGLFYSSAVLSTLVDASFGESESALLDTELGMVEGNTFILNIPASGYLQKEPQPDEMGGIMASDEDLLLSYVEGHLEGREVEGGLAAQEMPGEPRECWIVRANDDYVTDTLHCSNVASVGFLLEPAVNGPATFVATVLYRMVWGEWYNCCNEYACPGYIRASTNFTDGELPEESEQDVITLPLDVLPDNVTDLWNWDAIDNFDRDGDGLTNEEEINLGTDPQLDDTDGDGLSDKYEWETSADLGADPLLADTDGDGLNDKLEFHLGTKINDADSDADGLTDAEEVRRAEGGVLVGGWEVTLPGGTVVTVCSDPLSKDSDGDGLWDSEEKANGLNPKSPNADVPMMRLRAVPLLGFPGGRTGAYWLPGEDVTFMVEVSNMAAEPVTQPISLVLPDWLDTIGGGTTEGDHTIAMSVAGHTLTWPLSETSPLQVYEAISMTVTARVKPTTTSADDEIALNLLYKDLQRSRTVRAIVDGDNPLVAIIAPANGAYLRGEDYVVGGSASDPTTWIAALDLSIVPHGNAASYVALDSTDGPWAYTWELPATDGLYSLRARATDAMGHQATTGIVDVTVDKTPPTATLSWAMAGGNVHFSGTATDNLAGVDRMQIAIDGQSWHSVPLDGTDWAYDWVIGDSAQGDHEVLARAIDRSGNESAIVSATITADRVAPSNIVNGGAELGVPPAVKANSALDLTGVADEGGHLPAPAAPAELVAGMDVFDDSAIWLGLSGIRDNDGGVLAAWIGDFDANRLADLAVGLPGPVGAGGQVAILYGRAGGWPVPPDLEMLAGSETRLSGLPGARLGSLLAAAGDANGDSRADLLIGERASTRAFLIFGSPRPLGEITLDGGEPGYRVMLQAPATIEGLATAGDVDGDGYGDLLIRAGGTVYLVLGHGGLWPETLDVDAEDIGIFEGVTGALGVGDVDHDQKFEWVTLDDGLITLYGLGTSDSPVAAGTFPTADAEPRAVALGDVDANGYDDWMYSNGVNRILVYGNGTPHTFSNYGGFFAAPGDVDGDQRTDILLADGNEVAHLIRHQAGESAPEEFASIAGVGGAANAPYAVGADLNSDRSSDLLLIPSETAAEQRGFDAPDFSSGFISPQALPLGASSGSAYEGVAERLKPSLQARLLSSGPDTRYVDDDAVCDGHSPCFTTIQAAVNASDGGGDTVIVYPGAYASFDVPAGTSYDNLTVQGVNADAVFVEGGGAEAIRVAADGVRLSNLTVRNGTSGVLLEAGAGVPLAAGGPETVLDHLVAHSVQYPVYMSEGAVLSVTLSTLVGNGVDPILKVGATDPAAHTWNADRTLTTTLGPNGGLASTASTLYAMPGGTDPTVYASTPGTGGTLGTWAPAFQVPHEMPTEAGKSAIAAGGNYFFQMHPYYKVPDFGTVNGQINAVAVAADGDVYIGGTFGAVGAVGAQNIARWDSTDGLWHPLGLASAGDNGVDGTVYALTIVSTGDVYVGGRFDWAYDGTDVPAQNIVRWDGSEWITLGEEVVDGNGVSGGDLPPPDPESDFTVATVYALAHDSEDIVFVGGKFRHVHESLFSHQHGENHTYNFALYHPTLWAGTLGITWRLHPDMNVGGIYGTVRSFAWSGGSLFGAGTLYAGGDFLYAGPWSSDNVARLHRPDQYTLPQWTPMGTGGGSGGLPKPVSDIAVNIANSKVYAVSDDAASAGVYEWGGTGWTLLSGATGPGAAVGVDAAGNVYAGMVNGSMYALPAGGTAMQAIGSETTGIGDLAPDNGGYMLAARGAVASSGGIRRWASAHVDRRNLSAGTWQTIAAPGAMNGAQTPLIAADEAGNLYASWNEVDPDTGWQHAHLYALPAGSTTWQDRGTSPTGQHAIFRELVCAGSSLYAFMGYVDVGGSGTESMYYGTWIYDLTAQTWSWGDQVDQSALATNASPNLVSVVPDGMGHLFVLAPPTYGWSYVFSRYDPHSTWWPAAKPTILDATQPAALARVGHYLYAYAAPASGVTTNLFRYGEFGLEQRVRANRNVFVVPDTATSGAWRSADSYRFAMQIPGGDNQWVKPFALALNPSPSASTPLTSAQAAFVAPADGLYRLGAGSQVTCGYHQYKAAAHVYTSQAACTGCGSGLVWGQTAFATVREAVESGAARVLIHAGRYPQSFYLVSGVEVIGAGAELTIIEPPAGNAATLVSAEGVARASLARVTLAGGALWQGFLAEGGATGLRLARCIIRDLSTGVRLSGGSEVEIVNNTFVRNANGLVAEGTNPLNVRNTIFAYNTGTGLQRGASSALSVTYNDFYGNGIDMSNPSGSQSSVFKDPRFRSLGDNELRLSQGSPVIDMGAPNDPTVPGGGERVDIGYAEFNAAGFYVSKDYSETGENDGLTWGIDAFAQIQPALDAAADAMYELQGALPEGGYTVGVDAGTYAERVTVPSHVRLVGSGADVTTIDAGNGGSAVTFDSVIDSELSGFTVRNASAAGAGVEIKDASSGITLYRNVIRSNLGHGISFANKATGAVSFNTIVNNAGAGVYATGAATWARVRNNILDGNAYGLQAASSALLHNQYNLLDNTTNVSGVTAGEGTVEADAAFAAGSYYVPAAGSPAIDAAEPWAEVPLAGGLIADLGYKELIACPLTVLLGPEVDSAVTGNAGVAQVEVGVVAVSDANQPPTATLPSTWSTLTPASNDEPLFYWSQSVTEGTPGFYRVYSRATDAVGNAEDDEDDWYEGAFVVDSTAPAITWIVAPPATTNAAAVLAQVQVAGTVSTGTGTRDDVEQVYFSVSGPGGTVVYPAEGGRAWIRLPQTGSYTINAVAVDEAGNQAQANASVAVSASSSEATLSEPAGTSVRATAVSLRGYVRFTAAGSTQVDVSVTGGATVQATLDAPGAQFSAWSANITLPAGDGAKTVTITPRLGGTAGTATTLNLTLDTTAPTLSVATPAVDATVGQGVIFAGTATDAGSGLARVQVSLDGGYAWQQAALSGDAWSLDWEPAGHQDLVSYPAQLRAVDAAGNIALVERPVTVDSVPPSDAEPVTFSQPVGQHLDAVASCTVTWTPPVDNGGAVQVLLSADKVADGVPTTVVVGTSSAVSFNSAGDWYVHLMTQDASGNQTITHYGPWHLRNLGASQFNQRRESIILDGYLDLEHDEWHESDLLGIDARSGNPQALYLAIDGQYVFLGWDGAWWELNGVLWAYLDTWWSYGTGTGVDGQPIPAGLTSADRAIEIHGPNDGTLWSWVQDGDHWEWRAGALDFANGPSGGTEARVPFTAWMGHTLRVIAFALPTEAEQGAGGQPLALADPDTTVQMQSGITPWAVFPTTNALPEESMAQHFAWPMQSLNLYHINLGQPVARTLGMEISSPQSGGTAWCAGSDIEYDILLTNPEDSEFAGVTLILTATNGLTYQTVTGATLASGAPGDTHWTLHVNTLPAEGSATVVVTAHTTGASGITTVSSEIALSGGTTKLTPGTPTLATLSHLADGDAPTVAIDALGGSAIMAGENTFTGLASDGDGSGVTSVEVSLNGTTWTPTAGTLAWSATLDIAGSSATLQARAVDGCGLTGTATQAFVLDSTPPQVTWTLPAVITGSLALVTGSTSDPVPAGALVASVDVQVDAETARWQAANGPDLPQSGAQNWTWNWVTPEDDGVAHQVRVRASDEVGNTTVAGWQQTIVDTVAPALSVTQQATHVTLPNDPAPVKTSETPWLDYGASAGAGQPPRPKALELTAILGGTVADGAGVDSVRILIYGPSGSTSTALATLLAGAWEYAPDVSGWAAGVYALRVQAADIHGNVTLRGPYLLNVLDAPITGLTAANDGPHMMGEKVTLTASVTGGSNVAYVWDPGDGTGSLEGWQVTHIYALNGDYSAKVTASNSAYTADASTKVTIVALSVEAGGNQTANEGAMVTVAATFVDGRTGVIHTATIGWGDGTTPTAGTVDEALFTIAGDHSYADNGTYLVTVTLSDGLGNTAEDTLQVTVSNVAPTAALDNDGPRDEASAVTIWFKDIVEPGTADTLSYSFDWENDGTYDIVDQGTSSALHIWLDNGTYTVKGKIRDDDGGVNEYTTIVTVDNVAPTIALSGADSVDEGGSYALTLGTITDPGADTVTERIVNWGDGSSDSYSAGGDMTHVYAEGPSSPTITVDLTDEDGTHVGAGSKSITVDNVAPVITGITVPLDPVAVNSAVSVSATYSDAGTQDTHTAQWVWSNGASWTGTAAGGVASGSGTFSAAGIYFVTLNLTDDDGGTATMTSKSFVVVYDSSAGFVTGGGWIMSPAGAYTADTTLTGKANFSFEPKYKKGAQVPEGNTKFDFKAGGLDFSSGTHQWLVVAGSKAIFSGEGTINGRGSYGFMVTAWDGQIKGKGDQDKFRIKIWDKATQAIVYDNQMNAREDADPTTVLGGGSIVIHDK